MAYGNGRFFAGGEGFFALAESQFGQTWLTYSNPPISPRILGLTFSGGGFAMVGGIGANLAFTSIGISFFAQTLFSTSGYGYAIASDGIFPSTTTVVPTFMPQTTTTAFSNACAGLSNCSCSGPACVSTVPVSSSGVLSVSTASTLSVIGTLTLTGTSTLLAAVPSVPVSPLLSSSAPAAINGTVVLVVGAVAAGSVTLVSAPAISGTFESLAVRSSEACTGATSLVYSATTVTVTFQSVPLCSGQLSAGAVAGIVVGGVVVAAAVTLVVVLVLRKRVDIQDSRENARLREAQMNELQQRA